MTQAEGYVTNTTFPTGIFNYVYNYTDHLGNIRLSYQDVNNDGTIANSEILEESNYYPFGMKHSGYNSSNLQAGYKYKFNGKELQDELGLNMYDYGARNYDPALGRWMNVDPLAEKAIWTSPYTYCLNNPVIYIDPDGENPILGAIIGAFTEYAGIVGSKMLFDDMSFSQANSSLTLNDGLDITVAAGFGAASGAIDGGISKFASWAKSPTNQKILGKLLEVGIASLESSLKQIYKDEEFDLTSILSGAMMEVGIGSLLKTDAYKDASETASKNANASTKRAEDLAARKKPNEKLVNNSKKEASMHTRTAKSMQKLDNTGKVIKGTTAKTAANRTQEVTKTKKKEKKDE